MLPFVGIPTAALWIIAVILAFVNPGPIAGISHHTYTGALFGLTLVLTIVFVVIAIRSEPKRPNTLNSFALPVLLLLEPTSTAPHWDVALVYLVLILWLGLRTWATAPRVERPSEAKQTPWWEKRRK